MRNRCLFPANPSYNTYKHITVDPSWVDNFEQFFNDMGERPFGTTLDRVDGALGYTKQNCRWASHRVQQNNKPGLSNVEHNGVSKTIGEWAFELDLTTTELQRAYKRWSKYNASTFEELFCDHLLAHRVQTRENKCVHCGRTRSCKWRSNGTVCNTCYCRAHRQQKGTR